MPTGTSFNPEHFIEYTKRKLNKFAVKASDTVPFGTVKNIDYTLTDDVLLTGIHPLLFSHAEGDSLKFEIVHPSLGVVLTPLDWYVNPEKAEQKGPGMQYPAKLPAGMILRIKYTSVGANDVRVYLNYDLEKVLS